MNVEIGTEAMQAIPFLGKHKWNFRCSVQKMTKYTVLRTGRGDCTGREVPGPENNQEGRRSTTQHPCYTPQW
jgi:hypothetical protein